MCRQKNLNYYVIVFSIFKLFELEFELQIPMYHTPVFCDHSEWIKMMNSILLQGL